MLAADPVSMMPENWEKAPLESTGVSQLLVFFLWVERGVLTVRGSRWEPSRRTWP